MEQINELVKKVDFSNPSSIKDFINSIESGVYNGTFSNGKDFILVADKGNEISIHQQSLNPSILKVDIYQIDEDEPNGILYSELYEPANK